MRRALRWVECMVSSLSGQLEEQQARRGQVEDGLYMEIKVCNTCGYRAGDRTTSGVLHEDSDFYQFCRYLCVFKHQSY
jgi:hypothetical protein